MELGELIGSPTGYFHIFTTAVDSADGDAITASRPANAKDVALVELGNDGAVASLHFSQRSTRTARDDTPSRLPLYADENIHPEVVSALKASGKDVLLAVQAGESFTGIIYVRPGHITSATMLDALHVLVRSDIDASVPFVVVIERRADTVRVRLRQ